jgi:hypothetical protein
VVINTICHAPIEIVPRDIQSAFVPGFHESFVIYGPTLIALIGRPLFEQLQAIIAQSALPERFVEALSFYLRNKVESAIGAVLEQAIEDLPVVTLDGWYSARG